MDTHNYHELDSYTQNVIDILVRQVGWERVNALGKAALRDFDDMCADGYIYDKPHQQIVDRFSECYLSNNPCRLAREARKRAWEAARG
jgi:hypothetical protein